VERLTKLEILSLNGVRLSSDQALVITQSQRNLFMLGLGGVRLCTAEVRCILEICTTRLQFLHMSCFSDNEHALRALGEEYDVSIFFVSG